MYVFVRTHYTHSDDDDDCDYDDNDDNDEDGDPTAVVGQLNFFFVDTTTFV